MLTRKTDLQNYDLYPDNLPIFSKSVYLQCVFHSIRFKVNKDWLLVRVAFFYALSSGSASDYPDHPLPPSVHYCFIRI